jgi:hypothetical protein
MIVIEYRVEQRGSPLISGKEYPDFRVALYANGEWKNEWGNLWSKKKADDVAKRLNTNIKKGFL